MGAENFGLYQIPARADNYIWILHNPQAASVAVIDPGDFAAVEATLSGYGLTPTEVINTHHHDDHINGNADLRARYDIPLIAPASESHRIENISQGVQHGDCIKIAGYEAEVIKTPGHTSGHVAFYIKSWGDGLAFVGDNLFPFGCGRVFEGTMADMWSTLHRLRSLPAGTLICSGHEYGLSNAAFAESLNWRRPSVLERIAAIKDMTARRQPTTPSRLSLECETNPFLNVDAADLQAALGLPGAPPLEVFTKLRRLKDAF